MIDLWVCKIVASVFWMGAYKIDFQNWFSKLLTTIPKFDISVRLCTNLWGSYLLDLVTNIWPASITYWLDGYLGRKVLFTHSKPIESKPYHIFFVFNIWSYKPSLIILLTIIFFVMYMKLKSSFGAFLNPVADKVFFFLSYFIRTYFMDLSLFGFVHVMWGWSMEIMFSCLDIALMEVPVFLLLRLQLMDLFMICPHLWSLVFFCSSLAFSEGCKGWRLENWTCYRTNTLDWIWKVIVLLISDFWCF